MDGGGGGVEYLMYFSKRVFCQCKVNEHACWCLSEGDPRCDTGFITILLGGSILSVVRDVDRGMYLCGWNRCFGQLNLIPLLSECVLVEEGVNYTSRACDRSFVLVDGNAYVG